MKNIIIGPAYPLRGGIANFNEALCKAFLKEGVDSSVYSFSLQYPDFLFPGKTQFESGPAPANISIKTVINSLNPFNWILSAFKIIKEKPDYIIVRFWLPFMAPCLGTICRIIKLFSDIKIIALTDNVIPHEKRPGDNLLIRYFLSACHAYVTMSDSVKDDLKKFVKNGNILVNPHPVYDIFGASVGREEALLQLGLDPEYRYYLFFGFIRKYKGLDLLLQALTFLPENLKIKLIIAGEFYDDPAEYYNFIEKHGLSDRIILKTDYIPSEEVKYYFCASDLITQTYHSATQSGVTQIAYHFEKPMLVTDVGGLKEIVPDKRAGYVVQGDPKQIADAIFDFFTAERLHYFTENVKLEKKRFGWDTLVHKINGLYKSLLQSSSKRS